MLLPLSMIVTRKPQFNPSLKRRYGGEREAEALDWWLSGAKDEPGLVSVRCLKRNFNCRVGEIDFILEEEREVHRRRTLELVFVEVRAWSPNSWVGGLESLGVRKRQRMGRAIAWFLMRHEGEVDGVRAALVYLEAGKWIKVDPLLI